MKIFLVDLGRAATSLLLLGCLMQAAQAETIRSSIESANAQFAAAAAKGDGATLASLYTLDAQVMPAGSEPIRGKDAIQKFWQAALDSGVAHIDLKTVDVFGQGLTATEVGEYALRDKEGKVLDHGKYIVLWRTESGRWKLLRDMFSTNIPTPK